MFGKPVGTLENMVVSVNHNADSAAVFWLPNRTLAEFSITPIWEQTTVIEELPVAATFPASLFSGWIDPLPKEKLRERLAAHPHLRLRVLTATARQSARPAESLRVSDDSEAHRSDAWATDLPMFPTPVQIEENVAPLMIVTKIEPLVGLFVPVREEDQMPL